MQIESFGARDLFAPDLLPLEMVDAMSGVVTSRYADRGLIYSDNSFYRAGLMGDVAISQGAIDAIGMGGRVGLTAAQIDLWNGDRALDMVAAECRATGRGVRVRTVAAPSPWRSDAGGSLEAAQLAFSGVLSGMSPEGQRMRLTVDDLGWRLSKPLQANLYDGTGGLGGTAEQAGKPKPISFGWRYNATPVYIGQVDLGDGAKHTYQTHWRRIAGHDAVRERGVVMVPTGSAPGVGEWRDWPSFGCFQLGFSPNGIVTCDVRGDAAPSYASSTVQIIQRMLSTLGPRFGAADFDLASLALVDTQTIGEAGWGFGSDVITAAEAMERIAQMSGIWVIGNRAGQLRLAKAQFLTGVENMALDLGDILECRPAAMPASLRPTPQTVEATAARNWTRLTDIASGVSAGERLALSGEGRLVRKTSPLVSSRQFQARTMSLGGMFRYDTDAQRRVLSMVSWLEKGLRCFQVTTDKYLGQVELGHVANITYPLFGLENGFSGVVAGWSEQIGRRRVTMTLVG